ncbi:AFR521Wp [Eremothecium gossypii ATCC 10895]|uniref:GPI inositol-deacylase n=1 Tax=Eremothecium gossypii (strain ATCC 10895 / CBS 109.51 / FGSC 9923 / NRRL Y-1056) TaxID=284811 RepID=BST1_EREGS|nr:AFR521Wp [Eremothecium gossypii ATCC 10895]Q752Q2.2 RecName: Full=GPI inositol-deacylase [Eremothecium gossypii ATCC 10895]AAS53892.2 AFR521Wp [Eremothecium gossypii ATCC 10895]
MCSVLRFQRNMASWVKRHVFTFDLGDIQEKRGSDSGSGQSRSTADRYFNAVFGLGLLLFCIVCMAYLSPFLGSDLPQCRSVTMYPSYALVQGFDRRFSRLGRKYHLYLYREAGKDNGFSDDNEIHLDGIPVLFIPGNAGTYKQVRSIAAATANLYYGEMRDALNNNNTKNLDFFTADFNEDFTAFHGRTMLDQAEYCNDAIRYILSIYELSDKYRASGEPLPTSVLVVGHSMGGIVARVMTTLKNHIPQSINTILTLSSPHSTAPATFDGDILKIYNAMNAFWESKFRDRDKDPFYAENVSVISITGGVLDSVLPADYTSLEGIIPSDNGFTTYTTTIPWVWTPIDHLAIVWCDQLRIVVAKLLLELVDRTSASKTRPLPDRMRLARRSLLSGLESSASADFHLWDNEDYIFQPKVAPGALTTAQEMSPILLNVETYDTLNEYNYLAIPHNEPNLRFSLLTSLENLEELHILFCQNYNEHNSNGPIEYSSRCVSPSQDFIHVPRSFENSKYPSESSVGSASLPFKALHFNQTLLSKYDFIKFRKPSKSSFKDEDFVLVELSTTDWQTTVNCNPFQLLLSSAKFAHNASSAPFIQTFRFPYLSSSLVSYKLDVSYTGENLVFEPFIAQSIDSPFETKWHLRLRDSVTITIHSEAPFIPFESHYDKSVKLRLIAPPDCNINLSLSINWYMTLKFLFIRYRLAVAALPLSLVSFVLANQFALYYSSSFFPDFSTTLRAVTSKFWLKLTLSSILLTPILNISFIQRLIHSLDPSGVNSPFLIRKKNIMTAAYYLGIREIFMCWIGPLLSCITLSLVYMLAFGISTLESCVRRVSCYMSTAISKTRMKEIWLKDECEYEEGLVLRRRIGSGIMILAVVLYVPYQLVFVLLFLVQLNTVIKLNINYFNTKRHSNLRNYNSSYLLLMLCVLPINAPMVFVFLHNFGRRWVTSFRSHHNCLAILPIILLVCDNAGLRIPRSHCIERISKLITIGSFLYLSLYSVIYGIRNLFWAHHLVNLISGWLLFTSLDLTSNN